MEFSVSAASRAPRGTEQHGVEYYFYSADEFRAMIAEDRFVEYEEVYPGSFYGTLKSEVERIWAKGHVIIFDVDVKGGVNLKKYFGEMTYAPQFDRILINDDLQTAFRQAEQMVEDFLAQ